MESSQPLCLPLRLSRPLVSRHTSPCFTGCTIRLSHTFCPLNLQPDTTLQWQLAKLFNLLVRCAGVERDVPVTAGPVHGWCPWRSATGLRPRNCLHGAHDILGNHAIQGFGGKGGRGAGGRGVAGLAPGWWRWRSSTGPHSLTSLPMKTITIIQAMCICAGYGGRTPWDCWLSAWLMTQEVMGMLAYIITSDFC